MAYTGRTTAGELGTGGDNTIGADTGTSTELEPGKTLTVTGGSGVDTTISSSSGNITTTIAVGSPLAVSGNNLGVNTPSPSRPLTVTGVENEMVRLDNTQASGGCAINYRTSEGTDVNWAAGIHGSDSGFYISKNAATGTNDYVKVDTSGNVTVAGDLVLDDGGSLKEAGGTAAITFDGSGNVTKIGQDSMSSGDVLTWDGAKFVGESPTTGDITGVTAGTGLSGGGTGGGVTLAVDISEFSDAVVATGDKVLLLDSDGATEQLESVDDLITKTPALLTEAAVAVATDYMMFLDGGATGDAKKEAISDFVSGIAGSGLSESSGQLTVTSSGTITALNNQAENRLVTIGSTTTQLDGEANLTYDGSDLTATGSNIYATKHSASDGARAKLVVRKSKGTSGSPTIITDEDVLGAVDFEGYDGNSWATGACIEATVSGTPGDGDIPTKLSFSTAADGSESPTTRLTIGADGKATFTEDILLDDGGSICEASGTAALTLNSDGEVTKLNVPAGTVAQASDHIMFFDGGATGAPKVESIDDFLTAVAGSGLSVSSSQLTAGGGGAFGTTVQTKTAGYTVADGDGVILCDSLTGTTAFTITLPATGLSAGTQFIIKDSGGGASSYNITVDPQSKTLDGSTTDLVISSNFGSVTLLVDGSHNYWIM